MAQPVLVTTYNNIRPSISAAKGSRSPALPPISAYAFADIIRSADCPDFQSAIEGIAEICAKNRMSLAEEYASHLPPVGEITAASSRAVKPQLLKPGMRRALTSVPEASSGSSEGSRKSKRRNIWGFGARESIKNNPARLMRIGSMGRTVPIGGTTALSRTQDADLRSMGGDLPPTSESSSASGTRAVSTAVGSLQRLLAAKQPDPD